MVSLYECRTRNAERGIEENLEAGLFSLESGLLDNVLGCRALRRESGVTGKRLEPGNGTTKRDSDAGRNAVWGREFKCLTVRDLISHWTEGTYRNEVVGIGVLDKPSPTEEWSFPRLAWSGWSVLPIVREVAVCMAKAEWTASTRGNKSQQRLRTINQGKTKAESREIKAN